MPSNVNHNCCTFSSFVSCSKCECDLLQRYHLTKDLSSIGKPLIVIISIVFSHLTEAPQLIIYLILEQHGFELCGSPYMFIFFNKYSKCIFSIL